MKTSSFMVLVGVVCGIFATSMFFGSKDPTDKAFNAGLALVSISSFFIGATLHFLRKKKVEKIIVRLQESDWTTLGRHTGVR